jgi:Putative lumazine-binding
MRKEMFFMPEPIVAAAKQFDPESEGIQKTALDYIDGFYSGDPARMQRAVHPELAKRIVKVDPATGECTLEQLDAGTLVEITRSGAGKMRENLRQEEVAILDRYHDAAVVKIVANEWIDYLQMAKFDGAWKIINVLWALKPKSGEAAR